MAGRFAPSPTGPLHLGNLRTALVAWLSARHVRRAFLVRVEDLDPVTSTREHERRQLADLRSLGLDWDGDPVHQSDRFAMYRAAIAELDGRGLVYPCYCSRREIRDAAAAPHGDGAPDGAYPGTCRDLGAAERLERERAGRTPALRVRAASARETVVDAVAGSSSGLVDDVVLQRNDGIPAYNLAVVVDDHFQGVSEVVRGDDLLSSTPRQIHLQRLLGYETPSYAHVPLVRGPDGQRLAKRHGAVTMAQLAQNGVEASRVVALLGESLGLCRRDDDVRAVDLVDSFSFDVLQRDPWQLDPADL